MKKLLLTGGSGFIGRNVIPYLIERDYEIHIVYKNHILKEYMNNVKWHHCDLFDSRMQRQLLKNILPTHLLHFAWEATPGLYQTSVNNLKWVASTKNLLLNFEKFGGYRAVLAGTCAEYDWRYGVCRENSTPLLPTTLYGECKKNMRIIAEQFLNQNRISIAWGRIFFLYGPHEHPNRLVASVINSLLKGRSALCSDGNQERDFMFVKDVASAFVALLESGVESTVNIASGNPIKLKDAISSIAKIIGREDLLEFGAIKAKVNEPSVLIADTGRLNNEVGWFPNYTINNGLKETIRWWRSNINNKETM